MGGIFAGRLFSKNRHRVFFFGHTLEKHQWACHFKSSGMSRCDRSRKQCATRFDSCSGPQLNPTKTWQRSRDGPKLVLMSF